MLGAIVLMIDPTTWLFALAPVLLLLPRLPFWAAVLLSGVVAGFVGEVVVVGLNGNPQAFGNYLLPHVLNGVFESLIVAGALRWWRRPKPS